MSARISPGNKETSAAQAELDTIVLHIELTLISIIQGVALYFLIERSYELLVGLRIVFWPYVLTGLLIILLFWSRSMVHTLTVIRWPLDLTHNLVYFACTMVEAIIFTQLANPVHWYALNTVFGLMVWVLFTLDLRMIRRRIRDSSGPTGDKLYALVEREQSLNIKLFMPATVAFNLLALIAVRTWPGSLINGGGHVIIALAQMAAALGYQAYVMRFFTRIIPLILNTRQEWREDTILECGDASPLLGGATRRADQSADTSAHSKRRS